MDMQDTENERLANEYTRYYTPPQDTENEITLNCTLCNDSVIENKMR
jgi:hypothetical protein